VALGSAPHRAAAILEDRALHDLTNNDVFWDKVVEINRVGKRDDYHIAVAETDNVVVHGVSISTPYPPIR
jgi:replicative DNA helicase